MLEARHPARRLTQGSERQNPASYWFAPDAPLAGVLTTGASLLVSPVLPPAGRVRSRQHGIESSRMGHVWR
jgi:hypothetical protein